MINLNNEPEKCLLIGMTRNDNRWVVEDHLAELTELARTSGAEVVETIIQDKKSPDPAFFIGKGKCHEIADRLEDDPVDLIIFDDELSPAQVKNLENLFKIKVIDRSGVILDIFADHARTKEARTQVELAQLRYYLPRLTRQWQHLTRHAGGIGTRGPGETQLETDRRLIRTRITQLQAALEKIKKQKVVQRRKAGEFIRMALVGYTNAGKSTILNALTDAGALVEDKLFATLDTTVRRLDLGKGMVVLLSDTVGLIRKLPHHLIASFRTTLAQTIEADIILHVVDISDPHFDDKVEIVSDTLKELGIEDKPVLMVMNKVDQVEDANALQNIKHEYPDSILISARKKIGLAQLKTQLFAMAQENYTEISVELGYSLAEKAINKIAKIAQVYDKQYFEETVRVKLRFPGEAGEALRHILDHKDIRIIDPENL